mgnify:CR=1 FL=1
MKLRAYIAIFSVVAIGLVMLIFVLQTRETLSSGFAKLQRTQVGYIEQIVSSSLETKRKELTSFSGILRYDNDLASSYVLATESRDLDLIQQKIYRIKERVKFDIVEIVARDGSLVGNDKPVLDQELIARTVHQELDGTSIVLINNRPVLLSHAPLKLYDRTVGGLLLGYYLDTVASTDLTSATNALVVLEAGQFGQNIPLENDSRIGKFRVLHSLGGLPLFATVTLRENQAGSLAQKITERLILIGGLAMALLLVIYNLFLNLGFLRGFTSIIRKIESYAHALEEGRVSKLELGKFSIRENNLLASVFQRLSASLSVYAEKIREQSHLEANSRRQEALADLASQVAHDIRSPLAALNSIVSSLKKLPEEERLLVGVAIRRIHDISNNLLTQYREVWSHFASGPAVSDAISPHHISSLVDSLISEKRLQYRSQIGIEIEAAINKGFGLFARIEAVEFKRLLSNLVDNAVEALPGRGHVQVKIENSRDYISIFICDNGRGIPKDVLPTLMKKGKTYGKSEGSGIGLFHARTCLDRWGGDLSIESTLGSGTSIEIRIPKCDAPAWFATTLNLYQDMTVVVFDDDSSVHRIWQSRFEPFLRSDSGIKLVHFSKPDELVSWQNKNNLENCLLLADYEFLDFAETGLDLIEKLNLAEISVLVTSRYEEPSVRERCAQLGVKLIPKAMAGFVPIEFQSENWVGPQPKPGPSIIAPN